MVHILDYSILKKIREWRSKYQSELENPRSDL